MRYWIRFGKRRFIYNIKKCTPDGMPPNPLETRSNWLYGNWQLFEPAKESVALSHHMDILRLNEDLLRRKNDEIKRLESALRLIRDNTAPPSELWISWARRFANETLINPSSL